MVSDLPIEVEGMNIVDINDEPEHNNSDGPCSKKYNCETVFVIQLLYILAGVLWIALIYWCEIYKTIDMIMCILLIIPILVFAVGFYNACSVTVDIEDFMLGANYLSFGFLITIILINWNTPLQDTNKNSFFKLLVIAFVLIMLSMIDVWVDRTKLSILNHCKSILQTGALVILSIALYSYYRAQRDRILEVINKEDKML